MSTRGLRCDFVVIVGALHVGDANNVISELPEAEMSVRALYPDVRLLLEQRIKAFVNARGESFGVRAEIDWRKATAG